SAPCCRRSSACRPAPSCARRPRSSWTGWGGGGGAWMTLRSPFPTRDDPSDHTAMLVYIDESGDAGFKVDRGSSPVFVAAMVIFDDADDAALTRRLIEGSAARQLHKGEFKFSKTKDEVRDRFF